MKYNKNMHEKGGGERPPHDGKKASIIAIRRGRLRLGKGGVLVEIR